MWTDTHYYRFPSQEAAEGMELPELAAIDHIGMINDEWCVNARWWGEEPAEWEGYRIPAPRNPVRIFA